MDYLGEVDWIYQNTTSEIYNIIRSGAIGRMGLFYLGIQCNPDVLEKRSGLLYTILTNMQYSQEILQSGAIRGDEYLVGGNLRWNNDMLHAYLALGDVPQFRVRCS